MSQDNTQIKILRLLQEMKRILKANTDAPKDRSNRKPAAKAPDNSAEWCTNISKYFWTYGACGNSSKDFPHIAPDHKKDAIFDKKKGGSKARYE